MSIELREQFLKLLIKALVLFTALPVHECAHAWAAVKFGDDTPRMQGRLTLNPFAHLDLFGSLCMLLTGFGWAKPVVINPRNFKKYKAGNIIVSLAGPFSNILLALIVTIIYKLILIAGVTNQYLILVLFYIITLNLGLAVFNLIPIPPLDGSKVLMAFLPPKAVYRMMEYQMYIFIGLILVLQLPGVTRGLNYLVNGLLYVLDHITGFLG